MIKFLVYGLKFKQNDKGVYNILFYNFNPFRNRPV
jgi:hypothetical protein